MGVGQMAPGLLFAALALLTSASGVDFKRLASCESCQAAGYGWSKRRSECGGYIRQKCPDRPAEEEADDAEDPAPDEVWTEADPGTEQKSKKPKKPSGQPTKLLKRSFSKKVQPQTRGPPYWIVAFLDESEASAKFEAEIWRPLRRRGFGVPVHFGTVNATTQLHVVAKYGVVEIPGIAVFGKNKPGADVYGPLVHAELAGMNTWVQGVLPTGEQEKEAERKKEAAQKKETEEEKEAAQQKETEEKKDAGQKKEAEKKKEAEEEKEEPPGGSEKPAPGTSEDRPRNSSEARAEDEEL
ncbi:hypothetical protein DIPPA_05862 [Diplonema papillatum]|nr:hypothetical protein DIPPA_05862 [Diplonema papillatum]